MPSREWINRLRRQNYRAAHRQGNFEPPAQAFEEEMKSLNLAKCIRCNRLVKASEIHPRNQICTRCTSLERSRRDNPFVIENGLDFGSIPMQLRDLTLIEQILIARVHPVVSVFRIHGRQTGYSGHVVNFNQRVESISGRLPQDPAHLQSILLLNRDTPHGMIQFRVRAARVRDALLWLKMNNIHYSDISIDQQVIDRLPNDGDVSHRLPNLGVEEQHENIGILDNHLAGSCVPNIPAIDARELIRIHLGREEEYEEGNENELEVDWPEIDQNPLSERTEGILVQAFPHLFPYGHGDINSPRLRPLRQHEYFKFLMQYYDGRFAKDPRFPYVAYNTMARWDAINCGNVYVRQNSLQDATIDELRAMAANPDRDIASSTMFHGVTLRGTRPYWRRRCSELTQMVRQRGVPTAFFTLSAADYHWPDLFRILVPGRDPDSLTERERADLMHDNAYVVAWFFYQRCDIFMRVFLKVFFNITDFWYRFEWQSRGSPHVHGIIWLDGAKDCSDISSLTDEQRQEIIDYFDGLVSAVLEERMVTERQNHPSRKRLFDLSESERERDLLRLLTMTQRHTMCGSHCLRRDRRTGRMTCRFGYPKALRETSTLIQENGIWKFEPKRNDEQLQRYNKFISMLWRANIDFSPIVSKDAMLNYIAKYASKHEVACEAYTDILGRIISHVDPNLPAATAVRQLLIASIAERDFSKQEVMHLLLGLPLYRCSRSFVTVNLKENWRSVDQPSTATLINRYAQRPGQMSNLTLFDFVRTVRMRGDRYIQRQSEVIVRPFPYTAYCEDDDNEEHFMYMCKLHVPWRGDFTRYFAGRGSWEQIFDEHGQNQENDPEFGAVLPPPEEVQFYEPEPDPFAAVRDENLVAAGLGPNLPVDVPLGRRPIDEAFNWHRVGDSTNVLREINEFIQSVNSTSTSEMRNRAGPQVFIRPMDMSHEQRQVFELCRRQARDPNFHIRRVIVQGEAGTGKSALIKSMCKFLSGSSMPDSYLVIAPTGAAAVNIDGKTIHNALRIPARRQPEPLNDQPLRNFQLQMQPIRFIIIDEFSMIGLRLLNKIDQRLRQAKACDAPFGHFFIYFFGDLRQLPPVQDTPIYSQPRDQQSRMGKLMLDTIQVKIQLTTCFRQSNAQHNFHEALRRLARGQSNRDDWNLLNSRRVAVAANRDRFSRCLNLFPTNKQVIDHNTLHLSRNNLPVAVIEAYHNNATARQGSSIMAQGLTRNLCLSIGCRVMLRKNLCVDRGLVNGTLGNVRDILFKPGERPPCLPLVILVQFDNYEGPFIRGNCFPVLPQTVNWRESGVDCTRRQFPLSVAYAITIHKSQGLTLDLAIVDIGPKESAAGMSYVALSRVRRLEDLMIPGCGIHFNRLSMIAGMKSVIERERFMSTFSTTANINFNPH